MSGAEAAGFVLAVIPIVLQILEQYKEGLNRTAVLFRRRKHVEKLGHALLMQRTLLGETLKSLLLDSGVEGVSDLLDNPYLVLREPEVEDNLRNYLGPEAYISYTYAITQCERSVKEVTESIEGFGSELGARSGNLVAILEANSVSKKGAFDLIKRASLTLRKDGLEKAIREIDKSGAELERLQKVIATTHASASSSSTRRSKQAATYLHRVRQLAGRLHTALSQRWTPGCHDKHEVRLRLENRVDIRQAYALKGTTSINFDLVFSTDRTTGNFFWHQAVAEAPAHEDDDDAYLGTSAGLSLPPAHSDIPIPRNRVAFAQTLVATPHATIETRNICASIAEAVARQRIMRLHLQRQNRLCCDHIMLAGKSTWDRSTTTVTLETLLSPTSLPAGGHGRKISLKHRMALALNLASSMLQLHSTPWLGAHWSKDSVHFAYGPVHIPLNQQASTPPATAALKTDMPFIRHVMPNPWPDPGQHVITNAKTALLELGIVLLEIWHEVALESRFPNASSPSDYFSRLRLAWEWLEDVNNPPPDLYNSAMSQCIKHFFGGRSVSFNWEDIEFRRAICRDIIEPLHRCCKQWEM